MTHRAVRHGPTHRARVGQVIGGTAAMGTGIALLLHARLGLLPLDVLHAAISTRTGWTIGAAFIVTQMLFLMAYIPLRIRCGIGTFIAATVPAIVCDIVTAVLPPVDHVLLRFGLLLVGGVAFAGGVAAYLAAGLGALPRDGVMTELARRWRISLATVRIAFDVTSLLVGAILLGPANAVELGHLGPASVVLALLLGPSISRLIPRFTRKPTST